MSKSREKQTSRNSDDLLRGEFTHVRGCECGDPLGGWNRWEGASLGTQSQQGKKLAAIMEPGHDMSRASLGEFQQDSQVLNQDRQSRREALVRELQEVGEQLLARKGSLPEGGSSDQLL